MIINSATTLHPYLNRYKMKCAKTNNSPQQSSTGEQTIAPTQYPTNHETALGAELDKNLLVQRIQAFHDASKRLCGN